MFELDLRNAASYLASRNDVPPGPWTVTPLGGGVSNTVLLVDAPGHRFVLKQSLGKLRVKEEWLADRARIHRESASMRALAPHLPAGSLPRILFEDSENFLYAMDAAPDGARDWKTRLLAGEIDESVAVAAAGILAAQIRAGWQSPDWEARFGDQTCFDQLRLDPYYRFTAARHPDLMPHFLDRIRACNNSRESLVHGDFSPKNLLVGPGSMMLIDFEVIHYGDPSFDSAFLLNHLLLKAVHRPGLARQYAALAGRFWATLADGYPGDVAGFERSTIRHLGCLHLARVDGKSPAEYLTEPQSERARNIARCLILEPPRTVEEVFARVIA